MRNRKLLTKQRKYSMILISIMVIGVFISLTPNLWNLNSNSDNSTKIPDIDPKEPPFSKPQLSVIGMDDWWNDSFDYRRLINITNNFGEDLTDHIVSVNFNYTGLVSDQKMNASLKDIRIVENGIVRDYFVQLDHPKNDFATIWFEANISGTELDSDTYMYYGNNSVGYDESHFNPNNRFGIACYNFEEGSGDIEDSVGNYDDGELRLGTTYGTGKIGDYGVDLDGTDGYIYLPSINPTSALTVSVWIKSDYDYYTGSYWQMVSKYSAYIIGTSGGNRRMHFIVSTQSGGWQYMAGYDVADPENWHHFVGTFDASGNVEQLWVDGILRVTEPTTGGNIRADTGEINLGHRENDNPGSYHHSGLMDDVWFFDYALDEKEIGYLYNSSKIDATLNEEQHSFAELTITTYDVNGRLIPDAWVTLINGTTGSTVDVPKITSKAGKVSFNDLGFGEYNISVKYNLTNGKEIIAYNSSASGDIYDLTGLYYDVDVILNMTTIDFKIIDWDNFPVYLGYINISDSPASSVIDTLELNSDGTATFRWRNQSIYYYKIFYDNEDYNPNPTPLNESYINVADYIQNGKKFSQQINVNESNTYGGGSFYQINKEIFTDNSSVLNNKKLLKVNITLNDMYDTLEEVKIYYIDKNGNYINNLIYERDYILQTYDKIELDLSKTTNENLISDDYEAYGINVYAKGANSIVCNGTIIIDTIESQNVNNKTALAKLQILVLDEGAVNPNPVPGVTVRVVNGTTGSGQSVINLTTSSDEVSGKKGYAFGNSNSDTEFWYVRGTRYNFSLNFYGNMNFKVNQSDESIPPGLIPVYNYTLLENTTLIFKILIDISGYQLNFSDSFASATDITWGQNVDFSVNLSKTENGNDPSPSWSGVQNPTSITCSFGDQITQEMSPGVGAGIFTITFNTSSFSAGISGDVYWVEVTGSLFGYIDPNPLYFLITVNALDTDLNVHDYSNNLAVLPNDTVTQYYNEKVNITVSYFISGDPGARLNGALLSYDWTYGSESGIGEDPLYPGYYTFEINTSVAPSSKIYGIDITLVKENYSIQEDVTIFINILTRPTSINGTTDLKQLTPKFWILDATNFTFEYKDTLIDERVAELEVASYSWFRLDENGIPLTGLGNEGAGDLIETSDNLYILDFDTETREEGEYTLFVSLEKYNFEIRHAFITLTISKRTIDASLNATGLTGNQINVIQGSNIGFSLTLRDPTNGSQLLTGAEVTLTISGVEVSLTESGAGVYLYTYSTSDVQAFFMVQILQGQIKIVKDYYETKLIDLSIVVGMPEIFDGFPMFYFLMIIGAIIAVVGSLVAYRQILRARIPTFVKKVRDISKNIKGKKSISESLLYPSKDELILKKFGDRWKAIGLSLDEILGIEAKAKKKLPDTTEYKGGKG